jgi:DNA-binding NarL/FixJ family response regulator
MDTSLADRTEPLRIVLVDSDDLVRESLTGLLGIGRRVRVVGATGDPDQALRLVGTLQPDVVVVDPRLPELSSGLEFIRQARHLAPRTAVLAVGSADIVEQAAARGEVDGCVRKTFRPADLTAAILACRRSAA